MPRMTINGENYEVPDSDVEVARSQYGAVPVDSLPPAGATGPNIPGAIAGGVSSVLGSVGGWRGIGAIGAAGGALVGGKAILDRMRTKSAPEPPPSGPPSNVSRGTSPAAPKVSASLHTLTEDDIANVPAFRNAKPGEVVRRSFYEGRRFAETIPNPGKVAGSIGPAPKTRTALAVKSTGETVPIDVQERPAAVRGVKQKGVTKREIASRQKGMAATAKPAASDLEFQLEQSVKFERELVKRGIPPAQRLALRRSAQELIQGAGLRGVAGKAPGVLGMLLMLNDARTMPQQIDEAGREVRRAMDPKLARHLEGLNYPEGI